MRVAGDARRARPQGRSLHLLTGTAKIGDGVARIIAIRINQMLRSTPDYQQDVPARIYHSNNLNSGLETFLENVEDLTDRAERHASESTCRASSSWSPAHILLWILPLTPR